MRKALVTGVAGFMGSHVADHCLKCGFDVVGIDDLSGGSEGNVPLAVKFIKGSITNQELINNLFEERQFDVVYYLAAYAAEGLSHFIRKFNYENNLPSSWNLYKKQD